MTKKLTYKERRSLKQQKELEEAQEKYRNTVFLDTETTGLQPGHDELLEIAIVDIEGNTLLNTLVRPIKKTEWAEAQEIHGITPDDVKNAPALDEVQQLVDQAVEGKHVVIYNLNFDRGFIDLSKASSLHCAMIEYSDAFGEWNSYWGNYTWISLASASEHVRHNWENQQAHRALADTLACRSVWLYMNDNDHRVKVDELNAFEEKEREEWVKARHYNRLAILDAEAVLERAYNTSVNTIKHFLNIEEFMHIRDHNRDKYAVIFTGKTNDELLEQEKDRKLIEGCTRITSKKELPEGFGSLTELRKFAIIKSRYSITNEDARLWITKSDLVPTYYKQTDKQLTFYYDFEKTYSDLNKSDNKLFPYPVSGHFVLMHNTAIKKAKLGNNNYHHHCYGHNSYGSYCLFKVPKRHLKQPPKNPYTAPEIKLEKREQKAREKEWKANSFDCDIPF